MDYYMPHIHCLNGDWSLAYQLIGNDFFTCVQYAIFFLIFWFMGSWSRGGDWMHLCRSLSLIFVFCSLNYLMKMVVIYTPVYHIQLGVGYVSNTAFLWATYNVLKIGRTPLFAIRDNIKMVVQNGKF